MLTLVPSLRAPADYLKSVTRRERFPLSSTHPFGPLSIAVTSTSLLPYNNRQHCIDCGASPALSLQFKL